jgi:integrase
MASGEGLYKRPDSKFWWASWTDGDGKPRRKSTRTTNRAAALALISKWRFEAWSRQTGLTPPGQPVAPARRPSVTLEDLQAQWEREHEGAYLRSGQSRWKGILAGLGGPDRRACKVTQDELQELRTALARRMSRSSVNHHLSTLRGAWALAIERGQLTDNPTKGLRNFAVHDQRDRVMSLEEERLLLEHAKPGLARAIILAVDTGLRRGELAQLAWSHVDLERRVITLPARAAKNKRAWQVPVTQRVKRTLEPLERTAPIVPYTAMSLTAVFKRLCAELGIKDLRLHDLRHTAATRMRRAGVDWFVVMKILNHQNPRHAMRYQTVADQDLVSAADKLGALLSRRSKV